jgi:hypothetical protein
MLFSDIRILENFGHKIISNLTLLSIILGYESRMFQ